MTNAQELRDLALAYLIGEVSLADLDGRVAELAEVPMPEGELRDVWSSLELLLAERSVGHVDRAEFRAELASVAAPATSTVSTRAAFGDGPTVMTSADAEVQSLTWTGGHIVHVSASVLPDQRPGDDEPLEVIRRTLVGTPGETGSVSLVLDPA